ncbi:FAD binding domain-containing protein [Pseudonocardia ailaonensis]|uniref:FAD binding domain-containing protein n=1 Tax=Pseudonocardia ailaonensis TaxID=367279 RepID=A0ABN2MI96_9PSEU
MIPHLVRPRSVEELVSTLAGADDPMVVAGGTMLMPRLAQRTCSPATLVALDRLPAAAEIAVGADGAAVVGPLATYSTLLRDPAASPLLARIARGITGGPQIRNQGTVVGAACFANPASDMPAGLVAVGATMHVAGPDGVRDVPAAEFVVGPFRTALGPRDALLSVTVPQARPGGYCKIKRSESSWPLATAAALRRPDGSVRVAVGGALERPVALEIPAGRPVDGVVARELLEAAREREGVAWWADELADDRYRRRIAPVAVLRSVSSLEERA